MAVRPVMPEMIHQLRDLVPSPAGVPYVVQVWGDVNADWQGWLVFIAADGSMLRTGREISEGSREALVAWARRLRPDDVSGALARAFPPSAERPAA